MIKLQNEKWKTVKFDFKFTNDMRIEVSNCGRVRTFTKVADGNILKGALVNGYRMIAFKLFRPRDSKAEKRFEYLKAQISNLVKKAATDRMKLKGMEKKDATFFKHKKQINEADNQIKLLKESYRKEFRANEKKRTIHFNPLVHRLVAEYFCNKPSEKHNLVIHLDYRKQNNDSDNLKWVTQEEATAHWQINTGFKKQSKPKSGKRNENSDAHKLNRTKVAILKKRINEGKAIRQLCRQFGISQMQLWRIKKGINWGDVRAAV